MKAQILIIAALCLCFTQAGCYSTQKVKAIVSEYQLAGEQETLTGMREEEALKQWRPTISPLGPVLMIVTDNPPWYSAVNVVQKEHAWHLNPDGSLKEVHQTEGTLQVDFWTPVPYKQSMILEQQRFRLYEVFALASEWEARLVAGGDPYRFAPADPTSPPAAAEEMTEKIYKQLEQIVQAYKVRKLHFEYVTDIRNADGTLERQVHGGYDIRIPLVGGRESVELEHIGMGESTSSSTG